MIVIVLLSNLFVAFVGMGLVIPILPTLMNEMNIIVSVGIQVEDV